LIKETFFVSLHAGPGSGKSSMMADVFAKLKWMNIDAEMAPEYAKELVWDGYIGRDLEARQREIYFGQLKRIERLAGKVDVCITDSPLILSLLYNTKTTKAEINSILTQHLKYSNLDIYIDRVKPYNPNGRTQTEEEANALDNRLKEILEENQIPSHHFPGVPESALQIANMIKIILESFEEMNNPNSVGISLEELRKEYRLQEAAKPKLTTWFREIAFKALSKEDADKVLKEALAMHPELEAQLYSEYRQ